MSGSFVISLDLELRWGVPGFALDRYRENLLGVRHAVPAMLALFERYDVAAAIDWWLARTACPTYWVSQGFRVPPATLWYLTQGHLTQGYLTQGYLTQGYLTYIYINIYTQ